MGTGGLVEEIKLVDFLVCGGLNAIVIFFLKVDCGVDKRKKIFEKKQNLPAPFLKILKRW